MFLLSAPVWRYHLLISLQRGPPAKYSKDGVFHRTQEIQGNCTLSSIILQDDTCTFSFQCNNTLSTGCINCIEDRERLNVIVG